MCVRGRWCVGLILAGVSVWGLGDRPSAGLTVEMVDEPPRALGSAYPAILQPSEEASNLLSRANEAIEREDWKLAVDSLQGIVELPGEHVLTAPPVFGLTG